ncbi:hypothetical protein RIVM261_078320 [Rivularia sp. IAM M-261]|nr:hypothetical protein RIVM261_078320 [Rivularia sp. IAM M-261]
MHLNTINFQPFNRTEQETGASPVPPLKLTYNFDYQTFHSSDLTELAKATLGNFMGFVRLTFDGLLENGKALQNLYYECIATCPDGKKVFEEWLATDFAASRYLAESAMKISAWFEKLPIRLQCLIRQHVQQWKVSTLRQLTRVTENLLEEVVTSGKKTAAQVKRFTSQNKSAASKKASSDKVSNNAESIQPTVENSNCDEGLATKDLSLLPVELPEIVSAHVFAPGVRIIVQNDSRGYNNHSGIITDIGNNDDFWVLLYNTVAQGDVTKNLYKSNQLKPETQGIPTPKASAQTLTVADIEQIKAEAIRQYKLEHVEEEQGRYLEIKGAAISDAKKEIASFEKHAQNMTDKVSMLVKQLEEKEQEITRLNSLDVENQRLQQRVTELENALLKASEDSWGNTFNTQATIALNKDVKQKAALLLSEVEQLKARLQEKDAVIAHMQQQTSISDSDSVISSFGEIAETLGWNGWHRSGYRDKNGTLHKGMNAISAFVSDLTHEYQYYEQL